MKKSVIVLGLILTLSSVVVSCSHQNTGPTRYTASKECPVKGEYHSYFDEVEKCIEKSQEK
jgi:hypothetical protein